MAQFSAPTPKEIRVKTADCDVVIPVTPADGTNYQNMFLRDTTRIGKERLAVLMDLMCAAYKKGVEDGRREQSSASHPSQPAKSQ
jgi:ethanolamine utilization microcompartment shell protein EutL